MLTRLARYALDIGQSEDVLGLHVALAPCLVGYGAVAKMLHGDARTKKEGNHYWDWIENYVADDYVQAVATGLSMHTWALRTPFRFTGTPLLIHLQQQTYWSETLSSNRHRE